MMQKRHFFNNVNIHKIQTFSPISSDALTKWDF